MALRIAAPGAAHAARVLRASALSWLRREQLSLSLVTDAEMRRLNRDFRGKDRPTDVLSFPLAGALLGDVVISLPTARRQARAGGWSLAAELRRLLAHGILHCRGFDHEDARLAARMAAAERRLLGSAGMVGEAWTQGAHWPGGVAGAEPPHKRRPARAGAPLKKRLRP